MGRLCLPYTLLEAALKRVWVCMCVCVCVCVCRPAVHTVVGGYCACVSENICLWLVHTCRLSFEVHTHTHTTRARAVGDAFLGGAELCRVVHFVVVLCCVVLLMPFSLVLLTPPVVLRSRERSSWAKSGSVVFPYLVVSISDWVVRGGGSYTPVQCVRVRVE